MKRIISRILFVGISTLCYLAFILLVPIQIFAAGMSGGGYQLNGGLTPLESTSQTGDYVLHSRGDPIVFETEPNDEFAMTPSIFFDEDVFDGRSGDSSSGSGTTCQLFVSKNNVDPGTQVALSWTNYRRMLLELDTKDGNTISSWESSGVVTVRPQVTTVYTARIVGAGINTTCYTVLFVNGTKSAEQLQQEKDNIFFGSTQTAAGTNLIGKANAQSNGVPTADYSDTNPPIPEVQEGVLRDDLVSIKLSSLSKTVPESACLKLHVTIPGQILSSTENFIKIKYIISDAQGLQNQIIEFFEPNIVLNEQGNVELDTLCKTSLLANGAHRIVAQIEQGTTIHESNSEVFMVDETIPVKIYNLLLSCGYWIFVAMPIGLWILYKLIKKIIAKVKEVELKRAGIQTINIQKPPDF